MNRDYSNGDIQKIFDDFYSEAPQQAMRKMERARLERLGRYTIGHKRLALGYLEIEDPALFRKLLSGRSLRRAEPIRTSPLEQMKGLTGLLDPTGELTGGNYGSQF